MPKRKRHDLPVGNAIRVTRRIHASFTATSDTAGIQSSQQANSFASTSLSQDPTLAVDCEDDSSGLSSVSSLSLKPIKETRKKCRGRKPAPSSPISCEEQQGNDAEVKGLKPKQSRRGAPKSHKDVVDADDTSKPKHKRKPQPPIVYEILDVIRKDTTYKGRLGYACLNTVLRNLRPATQAIFCSRTCRIETINKNGIDFVKEIGLRNIKDLLKMIEWNEANNISFMRMSSEMFPFASHDRFGYNLEYADAELKAAGDLAKSFGHRLTMHPGQFTQIGSPNQKVVDASIRELEYHCEMMDRMGLGADGVMIIHMGGVYGDKQATLTRFRQTYSQRLSDGIKQRLVLENDEMCYNLDDLMPICDELNIPIVVDYHHDWINPSSRPLSVLIPLINDIWGRKGIKPKQHLSEPRPGAVTIMERRAHADRCQTLPPDLPDDMDLMIEAKDKEQAVFELYRIYGLASVIHENLRPPNPNPSLTTKGRKASSPKKRRKAQVENDMDADVNSADDLSPFMESDHESPNPSD